MTVTVKTSEPLSVEPRLWRRAGFRGGDQVDVVVSGGVVHIIPKLPSSDAEYTPEQRQAIDASLMASEDDLKAGRVIGPFESADQAIASMKAELKIRAATKKPKRAR